MAQPDTAVADQDPRRRRKFGQVLAGAREVFLRDGFEGASVDDIARAARVSKATLYAYFPDKRLLFVEVAKAECRRQAEEGAAQIDMDRPAAEVLADVASRILAFMTSDLATRVFRICVAEADRFPAIGHAFYHSGPKLVLDKVADFLRLAAARGELAVDDPAFAAEQFQALCKAGIHDRLTFGIAPCCPPADLQRQVAETVRMFMARYGAQHA